MILALLGCAGIAGEACLLACFATAPGWLRRNRRRRQNLASRNRRLDDIAHRVLDPLAGRTWTGEERDRFCDQLDHAG